MSELIIEWDENALKRLEKIPSFVRKIAKKKIEKAAIAAGENTVTAEFMETNRAKLME